MGKQNGKKVSQKQRSQKKSSSLKKYKKKGGSSQKGGIGYKYDVLIGKEDGGLMAGTRDKFINAIFTMINNGRTFEAFSNLVINPYTKQKVFNKQYTNEDVIKKIIVPYFFSLPGTKIQEDTELDSGEGYEEGETVIAEGPEQDELKEIPGLSGDTRINLKIIKSVEISAFQYAILKGNYELVNGIFDYINNNSLADLLKNFVKEPLAKSNGTDIPLTQPYYLPFTQGYYTEVKRLIQGPANVDAETMQQFVDLFKKYASNYTSINSQTGGDGPLTYDEVMNSEYMIDAINKLKTNIPPGPKKEEKEAELDTKIKETIETLIPKVNDDPDMPDNDKLNAFIAFFRETFKDQLQSTDSESKSDTDISSETSTSTALTLSPTRTDTSSELSPISTQTSTALVPTNPNECQYKDAPQCDPNNSKEENEKLLTEYSKIRSSSAFDPRNNRGCDPNKNTQQIADSVTGPARADAVNNCQKVLSSQTSTGPETITNKNETGSQETSTDGSPTTSITSGPPNSEIEQLRELLNQLVQENKIPTVSDNNNELRIVSASSADQQLGDQDLIEVDLTKAGKELNITYLTTENQVKTISISLSGPQTTSQGDTTPIQENP
jgi:hypothetical protein